MAYGPGMVTWTPRIEVHKGDELLGWTILEDVSSEAIPRVGEHVWYSPTPPAIADQIDLRPVTITGQHGSSD